MDWDTVRSFAWDVRRTLNQYLTVTEEQHFARRGRLLRFLDEHDDRPKLIAWLRAVGGDIWTEYLNDLEAAEENSKIEPADGTFE
ncbi:MAG: hypothetical protein ACYDHU_11710 [Acidimicrobiales bacterium]